MWSYRSKSTRNENHHKNDNNRPKIRKSPSNPDFHHHSFKDFDILFSHGDNKVSDSNTQPSSSSQTDADVRKPPIFHRVYLANKFTRAFSSRPKPDPEEILIDSSKLTVPYISEKPGTSLKLEKPDPEEIPTDSHKVAAPEKSEKTESSVKLEKPDPEDIPTDSSKVPAPDKSEKPETSMKLEKPDPEEILTDSSTVSVPEKSEKPETSVKLEKPDAEEILTDSSKVPEPEKSEEPETSMKLGKPDPEEISTDSNKVAAPEKLETPETSVRPENSFKLEKPQPTITIPVPGADKRVVVYMTSLRVVRPTFEACRTVRSILQGFRVPIDERDLSMDSSFSDEIRNIMAQIGECRGDEVENTRVSLPRVFIGGRYIGGAEEVVELHEIGELKKLVEGLPAATPGVCEICGGFRFILCFECDGSHKLHMEDGGFRTCTVCNENGLVRCYSCFSS